MNNNVTLFVRYIYLELEFAAIRKHNIGHYPINSTKMFEILRVTTKYWKDHSVSFNPICSNINLTPDQLVVKIFYDFQFSTKRHIWSKNNSLSNQSERLNTASNWNLSLIMFEFHFTFLIWKWNYTFRSIKITIDNEITLLTLLITVILHK